MLDLEPRPSPWGLAAVAAASFAWFVGAIAAVTELRQLAVVGLIDGTALAFLGPRVCRRLLLPLLYLFLLVPTGTVLLGPLQTVTTAMTVHLLHASGFVLFVDGTTIEAPHGVYIIAPGCAGLNFLLASLALSLVYADLLYRRTAKRGACILIALGLSVLANGLRVCGILAISELSARRIDIASDHLLYGWAFFSLVLVAAMALGRRFADPLAERLPITPSMPTPFAWRGLLATAAAVIVLVVGGQSTAWPLLTTPPGPLKVTIALPTIIDGWRQAPPMGNWLPSAPLADARQQWSFVKDGHRVDVVLAYVWRRRDGHTLPVLQDWITANDAWAAAAPHIRRQQHDVVVQQLSQRGRQRLVYSWYWVAGRTTARPLAARLEETLARLRGDGRVALFAISTNVEDESEAEAVLDDFLAGATAIDDALTRATPGNAG